ncbi:MAG: hypothetical protein V1722_01555 [Candidatus Micrarchaeota archaeon]
MVAHRIIWLKVGSKRFHLLKLAGAFFIFAAVLKVAEAAYQIFVTANKATYAQIDPTLIPSLFGWAMGAQPSGGSFLVEDLVGVLLGPIALFLFWLGLAVVAIMVYQSGKVILPIEEYEQQISDHHKNLIRKAVQSHKRK